MKHTLNTTMEILDTEVGVEIEFTYHEGYCGSYYEPPEQPSVEMNQIKLYDLETSEVLECPRWLEKILFSTDLFDSEMFDCVDTDGSCPDRAYDLWRDRMMMGDA